MRRKHSEVTDPKEIERILASTNIGRLATNGQNGYPYIIPVNFVNLAGNIYFHCAPKGEKLDNLRRDPVFVLRWTCPSHTLTSDWIRVARSVTCINITIVLLSAAGLQS